MRRSRVAMLAAGALVLGACGSGDGGTAATSAAPSTAAATTAAPSTVADTTAPPSTQADTTAVTTPPAQGWAVVDPESVGIPLAQPCCGSNWFGVATSPELPTDGSSLADGVYRISFDWPVAPADSVSATVRRFLPCAELPTEACEPPPEGFGFTPDDYGVDPSSEYGLTLVLDGSVQVVLGGFHTFESKENVAAANGADLLDLIRSVDADFDVAIMQPHLAGTSDADIAAGLAAAPANGFGPPEAEGAGQLIYRHLDAPPLLYQALFYDFEQPDQSRGSDVIGPIALKVDHGTYTLTTYAGFYS